MTKILFLDCDGTIREPKSGAKFISAPEDQKIIKGADKAIANYAALGYTIIGVSNQGGVGAGHKSLSDCIAEQAETLKLLPQIQAIYFCPDFEGNNCWYVSPDRNFQIRSSKLRGKFRKPDAGMVVYALWCKPEVELSNCLMVGDRFEDEAAAAAAGVQFLWAADWIEQAGWSE